MKRIFILSLIAIALLSTSELSANFTEDNTTVSYNDCNGIVSIRFPISDNNGVDAECIIDGMMDRIFIYQVRPNNTESEIIRVIWDQQLSTYTCNGFLFFPKGGTNCRGYRACGYSGISGHNGSDKVGDKRYVTVTYNYLDNAFFGNPTKIRIAGRGLGGDFNKTFVKGPQLKIDAPSGLSASYDEDCPHVALSWTSPTNIETTCGSTSKWYIEVIRDNGTPKYVGKVSAYNDTGATKGVEHTYKVRAVFRPTPGAIFGGRVNKSTESNSALGKRKGNPNPPSMVMASTTNCDGSIGVSWVNTNTQPIQKYHLQFSLAGQNNWMDVNANIAGTESSETHMNPVGSEAYDYRVRAQNDCGDWSMYAMSSSTGLAEGTLAAPTSIMSTKTGNTTINVFWTYTNALQTGFTVERTFPGGGAARTWNVDKNDRDFSDSDVNQCVTYTYRVLAKSMCFPDGAASLGTSQRLDPDLSNALPQSRFDASKGYFTNRVELQWENLNEGQTNRIKIWRRILASGDNFVLIASENTGTGLYSDATADAGILYEYKIFAEGPCENNTLKSNEVFAIGFRTKSGRVNGKVSYTGGFAVEGVKVTAESSDILGGNSLNSSAGHLLVKDDSKLDLTNELLVETWFKPTSHATDFWLFEKDLSYKLHHNSTTNTYDFKVWYNTTLTKTISIPEDTVQLNNWNHIAAQVHNDSIFIYVRGKIIASDLLAINQVLDNSSTNLKIGEMLPGCFKEARVWNTGKDENQLFRDYSRFTAANEQGLIVMLNMSEGLGSNAYDRSYSGASSFNKNHAQFMGTVVWTTDIPSESQLSYASYTNASGNYQMTLPYFNAGENYTLTPVFFPHKFDPEERLLFIGDGSSVINGIDFEDISSFKVTGSLFYKDTNCPVKGAQLAIDGNVVTAGNSPVTTLADGSFEVQVPIGEHVLSVQQGTHVYSLGSFPPTGLRDFQAPVTGIEFRDSTLVKVIGRVVGGSREAKKTAGFGLTTNNIGTASFRFKSQLGTGCVDETITTDPNTGEYMAMLPPLKYEILDLDIVSPESPISFESQGPLEISQVPPVQMDYDTLPNNTVRSVSYQALRDFIYRSELSLDVQNPEDKTLFSGDTSLIFTHSQYDTDTLDLNLNPLPFSVFRTGIDYTALISTFEQYINYDAAVDVVDRVPVLDGIITITNSLATEKGFTIDLGLNPEYDGDTLYTFTGNYPNTEENVNNMNLSFTHPFLVDLNNGTENAEWKPLNGGQDFYRGFLFGTKPIQGTNFATQGPEVVDYILRDPPSSQGSSTLETGTSMSKNVSWSIGGGVTGQFNKSIDAGVESFVGLGFVTRNKITFTSKFQMTGETVFEGGGSRNETTTMTETISTSSEPKLVGHKSDLFIGTSRNYTFGLSNVLQVVPTLVCSQNANLECFGADTGGFKIGREKKFVLDADDFETEFVHTTFDIETYEIPLLINLRNELLANDPAYISNRSITDEDYGKNNDDPTLPVVSDGDPNFESRADTTGYSYTFFKSMKPETDNNDQIRRLNQQVRLWKEALAMNEEEKATVSQATLNHSFSGGGASISESVSSEVETVRFFNWELQLNESIITKLGAEIAGAGVELEHSIGLSQKSSANETTTTTTTNTVGYTLSDDSEFDRFTLDVFESINGFGPIFKLVGGQSSCPYEDAVISKYYMPGTELSTATIQLELPTIGITPARLDNVPQDELGVFTLTLGNASFEGWEYELDIVNSTNPNGLLFNVDYGGANSTFRIDKQSSVNQQLFVTYGTEYQNDSLLAVLYSTCQYQGGIGSGVDIVDSVYFSIGFIPGCTDVTIKKPQDQWILNNGFNDTLPIEIEGYDINYFNLEKLVLEYKSTNESSWSELQTYWHDTTGLVGNNILPIPRNTPGSFYNWIVDELGDGEYDVRARSVCSDAENESEIRKGYIDRINPHAFGSPSPADGILDPNDDILMKMNEEIEIGSITSLNFDVRGVLNGAPLSHGTSISFDGINDYATIPEYQLQRRSMVIEFWAKRARTGAEILLSQSVSPTDQLAVSFDASDKVKFQLGNNSITSLGSITDQKWHHIAIVYNRSTNDAEIVIDFTLDNTDNNFGTDYNSTGDIMVGKHASGGINMFQGFIHELRLWGTPRTATEIGKKAERVLSGREAGLIGNWPMDEAWGSVAYDKVRSRHAQLTGTTWTILPQNHSFLFNGTNNYLIAENADTLGFNQETDITLEAWFKTSATKNQSIFSNGKADGTRPEDFAWNVHLNSAGKVVVENDGNSITSDSSYNNNDWHHAAIVIERTRAISLYIDGELVKTGNASIFKGFLGPKLWVGARGWFEGVQNRDQYFNGRLDDIRIWNVARKPEQIQRDFVHQLKGDELGLQAYYPFDGVELVAGVLERIPDRLDGSRNNYNLDLGGGTLDTFDLDAPPIKLPRIVEKVNFTYSINNDEIFIEITDPPARVENVTLDITVSEIKDLAGNVMQSPETWIAYIDKNQVFWEQEYFQFEKKLEDNLSFTSNIKNTGGSQEQYSISNLPTWLSASPSGGLIEPNSTIEVTFTVQPLLNIGEYEQDVFVSTTSFGFNERLLLDLKVIVDPPDWEVDVDAFSGSMNITGEFKINGVISTDPEDMVSVWVNGELRGVTHVEYDPSSGKNLVFLTILSNAGTIDPPPVEPLEFRAWDASRGRMLIDLEPSNFAFLTNQILGSRTTPISIEATVLTELEYVMSEGWNWISFPLASADLSSAPGPLGQMSADQGNVITNRSDYLERDQGKWEGNLNSYNTMEAYKVKVAKADTFYYSGTFMDPSTEPISIINGWNWISVKSEFIIDVPSAMASLDPQTGDLIKGQRSFAIYEDGFGWGGNLDFLEPQKGYMLKYHQTDQLTFPGNLNIKPKDPVFLKSLSSDRKRLRSYKSAGYVPGTFGTTMSLTAKIDACLLIAEAGDDINLSDWEMSAYVGTECRGVVGSTWEASINTYLYYLSIEGDQTVALNFKLIHSTTGQVIELSQTMDYTNNSFSGTPSSPVLFTCKGGDCDDNLLYKTTDIDASQTDIIKRASIRLQSDAILPSGIRLVLKAGNHVEMLHDFEIGSNARLEVYIEDCENTNN